MRALFFILVLQAVLVCAVAKRVLTSASGSIGLDLVRAEEYADLQAVHNTTFGILVDALGHSVCAMAIVANGHALAAASCFEFTSSMVFGGYDVFVHLPGKQHPSRAAVVDVTIHPYYDPETFANNLAYVSYVPGPIVPEYSPARIQNPRRPLLVYTTPSTNQGLWNPPAAIYARPGPKDECAEASSLYRHNPTSLFCSTAVHQSTYNNTCVSPFPLIIGRGNQGNMVLGLYSHSSVDNVDGFCGAGQKHSYYVMLAPYMPWVQQEMGGYAGHSYYMKVPLEESSPGRLTFTRRALGNDAEHQYGRQSSGYLERRQKEEEEPVEEEEEPVEEEGDPQEGPGSGGPEDDEGDDDYCPDDDEEEEPTNDVGNGGGGGGNNIIATPVEPVISTTTTTEVTTQMTTVTESTTTTMIMSNTQSIIVTTTEATSSLYSETEVVSLTTTESVPACDTVPTPEPTTITVTATYNDTVTITYTAPVSIEESITTETQNVTMTETVTDEAETSTEMLTSIELATTTVEETSTEIESSTIISSLQEEDVDEQSSSETDKESSSGGLPMWAIIAMAAGGALLLLTILLIVLRRRKKQKRENEFQPDSTWYKPYMAREMSAGNYAADNARGASRYYLNGGRAGYLSNSGQSRADTDTDRRQSTD